MCVSAWWYCTKTQQNTHGSPDLMNTHEHFSRPAGTSVAALYRFGRSCSVGSSCSCPFTFFLRLRGGGVLRRPSPGVDGFWSGFSKVNGKAYFRPQNGRGGELWAAVARRGLHLAV